MNFIKKIFGSKGAQNGIHQPEIEDSVIIHFNYGIGRMDELYELRDKLEKEIEKKNLGEYDGHEIAIDYSDGYLFMYGPNAEKLFNGIKDILDKTNFMKGAKAKLRFESIDDHAKEIIVEIGV